MSLYGSLSRGHKNEAIFGDRWWRHDGDTKGDGIGNMYSSKISQKRKKTLTVGNSIFSRTGAPSQKKYVVRLADGEGNKNSVRSPPHVVGLAS